MSSNEPLREIIFETIRCGDSQKISAIDVSTGFEVSIIAPLYADEAYTRMIAAGKLERQLAQGQVDTKSNQQVRKTDRRGIIV